MKKVYGLLLVCAGVLVLPSAVNATSATTDATVDFGVDNTGEIVKPDEDPEDATPGPVIQIPGGGNQSTGPLRIQFVPHFNFKQQEAKVSEVVSPVKVMEYNEKTTPTVKKYVPTFAQVSDYREAPVPAGKEGFKLSVKMTTPFTNKGVAYKGMKIKLNEQTLTNNTSTAFENALAGFSAGAEIVADGPEVKVLSAGSAVPNSQSSVVFANNYVMTDNVAADTYGNGVQLVKPSGMSIGNGTYTAQLTWTVTEGL